MMLRSRRTVRMRLTALYSALFVLSAVVLLAITNGVGSLAPQRRIQHLRDADNGCVATVGPHRTSTCSARRSRWA